MTNADTSAEARDAATGDKAAAVHYVDLALGGWRPREAAFQLAAALGVTLTSRERVVPAETDPVTGVDLVDIAARGDPLVNQAWEDASRIAARLAAKAVAVVLAPRFGLPLRADNEWFFHFLRRLSQTIVIVGEEPPMRAVEKSPFELRRGIVVPEWQADPDRVGAARMRLLRLFPGLIPWRLAEAADLAGDDVTLVPVGESHFLVPMTFRDTDPRDCAFDFDALEELEVEDEGIKALAQSYCTSHFVDVVALTELGWRHFRSGSRDLGRDLVERAHKVARDPAAIGKTKVALLEMDTYERRFAEVVAAPALSPRSGAADRERLQYLKNNALLATDDLSATSQFVAESLRRLGNVESIDAEDVLRLDRVVGARLRSGDLDGAAALGRSVAAALAHAGPTVDQRLVYANAMTMIGVCAARGERDAQGREIERAFDTALGARGTGDVLLMNFLRAKAEPDQTSRVAADCWLRAGLAWLAHEPREGLGRDAVEAILGADKAEQPGIDDEISGALVDAFSASWPDVASTPPGRAPEVYPASALLAIAPRHMYAGPGAAVLWTTDTMTAPPASPQRAKLVRLVCAAVAKICPPFALIGGGTMSIDLNVGKDIPTTREEALSVALRLGVEDFCFGGERLRLDAGERERMTGDLEVRLSPAVKTATESGDGLAVTFKRYLPSVVLFDENARLVAPLSNGDRVRLRTLPMVADGQSSEQLMPALRRLEAAHIIRVDVRPP
jgi:hypothetical protein